jgi:hypothetical protein
MTSAYLTACPNSATYLNQRTFTNTRGSHDHNDHRRLQIKVAIRNRHVFLAMTSIQVPLDFTMGTSIFCYTKSLRSINSFEISGAVIVSDVAEPHNDKLCGPNTPIPSHSCDPLSTGPEYLSFSLRQPHVCGLLGLLAGRGALCVFQGPSYSALPV